MKTPRSAIGRRATTWLMLQVPAMIDACPSSTTPEPSALATTSNRPRDHGRALGEAGRSGGLGGDPADDFGRPEQVGQQRRAHRRGHRPPAGRRRSGSRGMRSSPAPLMSEMSETRRPVRRKVTKSLHRNAVPARA